MKVSASLRRLGAPVILVAALFLAGCGATSASSAAVVGGTTTITEEDVRVGTEQFNASGQLEQPVTPSVILGVLIQAPTVLETLAAKGVSASEPLARDALRKAGISDPAPATVTLLRFIEAVNKANTPGTLSESDIAELNTKVAGLKVVVNPRYGSYDGAQGQVVAQVPSWIVAPK